MKKRILLLGSTGSIGRQTLDVVRASPDVFSVVGLGAGANSALLAEQVQEFRPQAVCTNGGPALGLDGHVREFKGSQGLVDLVRQVEADVVVVATSGRAGFAPTMAALELGRSVALANKEVLVMAGDLVTRTAHRHGATILPIDSEHSAIWQCLQGEDPATVQRLILAASGGPFLRTPQEALHTVTPEQALQHPTWSMGAKITIDSATLVNKGLEVIEAHWLFSVPYDTIDVVIHPQSIVHSLVAFADGSVKAQMGHPDMRLPIQYALGYPGRLPVAWSGLDFARAPVLEFLAPDVEQFPCLALTLEAGRTGGTAPAVLCAADEVAVHLFLEGRIGFLEIAEHLAHALDRHIPEPVESIEQVLAVDNETRVNLLQSVNL